MGPGWSRLLGRLYRLRLASGILPAAPALFLLLWYAGAAVAEHVRHDRAAGEDRPLDAELFQLHLHDHLARDLRALKRPPLRRSTDLPTVVLTLGAAQLAGLAEGDAAEGPTAYVDGFLQFGRDTFRVQVRYRGQEAWHRDYPQKSWKVRVQDGRLVHGTATFSLVNTPEPLPFDEQLVLDVAREGGLLTPAAFPIRLLFNDAGMGVYYFVAQPDMDLLRAGNRVPGALFSGNDAPVDPATGVSRLWDTPQFWKQVAAADGPSAADADELGLLLTLVGRGTQAEFARFARDHLALPRLALLDAIDVVFGVDRHDYGRNHKLLLDPYTGRFEPVAWDFRGWRHTRELNRAENPLLLRLKELPEYLTLRNREVWRLLHGPCAPTAIRRRIDTLVAQLAEEQAADPYWDAYELLPEGATYFTRMVRPMTAERQQTVLASRFAEYGRRVQYLMEELSRPGIDWTSRTAADGRVAVEATVDGHAGYRVDEVAVDWPETCVPIGWRLSADRSGGSAAAGADATSGELGARQPAHPAWRLFPGTVLEPRDSVDPDRGAVVSTPAERSYRLWIDAGGCLPGAMRVRTTNLVTGSVDERTVAPEASSSWTGAPLECVEPAPGVRPGRASLHPWCLPAEPRRFHRLGPGTVRVERTLDFGPSETVSIAPGTTLELAPGASLIFRGPLFALGTAEAPIRLIAQRERWGGLALLGPGTAGSQLVHLEIRGATAPRAPLTELPAAVNVHDTAGVMLAHCRIAGGTGQGGALHAAYVQGLTLSDLEIRRTLDDAVDYEFVTGVVHGLTVVGAGQEALDLMGGAVVLTDSRLLDCDGNGISVGSGAQFTAARVLVAGSRVGLLVKSGSRVQLEEALFQDDGTAAVVRVTGEHWPGSSSLRVRRTRVVGCRMPLRVEDGVLDSAPDLQPGLQAGALGGLRGMLGLADWDELEPALRRWRESSP